jgi:signal transduction histidine kinase
MALHQALSSRRDDVIARWKQKVQGEISPEAVPHFELIDHIPQFLDEIVDDLKEADEPTTPENKALQRASAADHGAQRLRLGFSLEAVVKEYGALRDAIVVVAREAGAEISFAELQAVFDCIVTGIAHAVSEYSRQRDAELMRQANEHFAFVAHELRNPLASATLALSLLKSQGRLPAENRSVAALEKGLRRTAALVDETLQVARVASGIELRRRPTTLGALFEEAAAEVAPQADAKEIEIKWAIENDQRLELDGRLLSSALGNLAGNAVKYSAANATVQLRGKVGKERVRIEVEDCCGGLPPGKIEQAFSPFVRLDKQQDGFGLGLAIAKQAAEAHGGSIRVQNLPSKGCVFVLELPLSQAAG